jgi:hypothetical protein
MAAKANTFEVLTADRHDSMVDHMQRRHLVESFSHDKEECVKELSELAEVIQVNCVYDLRQNL